MTPLLRVAFALLSLALFYGSVAPFKKGSMAADSPQIWRALHFTVAALSAGIATRRHD